ncbi:UMP kinase activity protein [Homalodisca vitripennis]|nr:UMP kinase activity protein [Homalodisca vitripennis]
MSGYTLMSIFILKFESIALFNIIYCSHHVRSTVIANSIEACQDYGVFYSFDAVMQVFNDAKYYNTTEVRQLMRTYQETYPYDPRRRYGKRKPFIVVESTRRDSRRSVGWMLARSTGSRYMSNPPRSLVPLRDLFDNRGGLLRRAYFSIGMYAAAHDVLEVMYRYPVAKTMRHYYVDKTRILQSQNVTSISSETLGSMSIVKPKMSTDYKTSANVFDIKKSTSYSHSSTGSVTCTSLKQLLRYWHDQAAFAIAKEFQDIKDLPPPGDPVYRWPADLLKPDLVFFINSPDRESGHWRVTPRPNVFKPKLVEVMRRMYGMPVLELNDTFLYDDILLRMQGHLDSYLPGRLNFQQVFYKDIIGQGNNADEQT